VADQDGGPILQRQDATGRGGILGDRHKRILYCRYLQTGSLQVWNNLEPTGSVRVQAVNQDDILCGWNLLRFAERRCCGGRHSGGKQSVDVLRVIMTITSFTVTTRAGEYDCDALRV
jgi:hypothetical protein